MGVIPTGLDAYPEGANCEKCTLNKCPYVPSYGPDTVRVVLVGECPGDSELRQGRPFVGRSGQLLDRIFDELEYDREACFIANACCCRPLPHRAPNIKEIRACRSRLVREVKERSPQVVILLGNAALKALGSGQTTISSARGSAQWSNELDAWVVPTYHPAAVLRSPSLYPDMLKDMRKALSLLHSTPATPRATDDINYVLLDTREDIDELVNRLRTVPAIALDTETASDGRLICIGMSWKEGTAVVVTEQALADPYTIESLKRVLPKKHIIGHNLKFDNQVLWRSGITGTTTGEDTMLMHYTQDERRGIHGLKQLAREYLNAPDYDRELKPYLKKGFEHVPKDVLYRYNALDAHYTFSLANILRADLTPDDSRVLTEILYPASNALARMEYRGVMVDVAHLEHLQRDLSGKIDQCLHEMYTIVGREFNPNSYRQLVPLLYDELNLPIPGRVSTDEESLSAIKDFHPLPSLLLRYRELKKLYSTYVEALLEKADAIGRIHCNFNLHGTTTGRLSSSNPNLQNIPRDGDVRNIFIATPRYTLLEGDLSQAEVRCLAYYCKDKALIEAVSSEDVHQRTACLMFGISPNQVTKEMRQKAKHLTFGVIYQMGAPSLAEEIGCSVGEAEELIKKFFDAMPKAREWINAIQNQVLRTGRVATPFGRVRRFEYITNENKAEILRQAVNAPIQSLASDMTLKALIRLDHRIQSGELGDTHLLITVHDSIMLETREDPMWIAQVVYDEMCQPLLGNVPIMADIKIGSRWGSLEKVQLKKAA